MSNRKRIALAIMGGLSAFITVVPTARAAVAGDEAGGFASAAPFAFAALVALALVVSGFRLLRRIERHGTKVTFTDAVTLKDNTVTRTREVTISRADAHRRRRRRRWRGRRDVEPRD